VLRAEVHPAGSEAEAPIEFEHLDEVSFVNGGTHGNGDKFGIVEGYDGRKLFINTLGFTSLLIERGDA